MEIKSWMLQYENYKPIACTAPCSLYSVLLDNKLMGNPFYGINEQAATKLCEEPCEFSTTFEVTEKSRYMELKFGGLDTICDIYLNGRHLDSVNNMHRSFVYDVQDKLLIGENSIRLRFGSPIKYFRDMDNRHSVFTNLDTIPGASQL